MLALILAYVSLSDVINRNNQSGSGLVGVLLEVSEISVVWRMLNWIEVRSPSGVPAHNPVLLQRKVIKLKVDQRSLTINVPKGLRNNC